MVTRHVTQRLAASIDGELAPRKARRTALHLEQCGRCQAQSEQVRFGMAMIERLPLVEAPEEILPSIAAARPENRSSLAWRARGWRLSYIATFVLALAGAAVS